MKTSLGGRQDRVERTRPPPGGLPRYPVSWYLFCRSSELAARPLSLEILGKRLVAYRTTGGKPVVMDARCSHMGADLGCGRVVDDALQCPLHHWEYGPDGRCRHIPAGDVIPPFAGQRCYPTAERAGFVFLFNGLEPSFPFPFFSSASPEELVAARPFTMDVNGPWHTVGANHFDLQHYRATHDRKPVGEYSVDCPEPFARRASCCFAVGGNSLQNRLTRRFAGDRVTMTIVDWCGTLMFVTAEFPKTTTYGWVSVLPVGENKARVAVIVLVRKSRWLVLGTLLDFLNASFRSRCIRRFLQSDFRLLSNVHYDAKHFIESDRELAGYFQWVRSTANGIPYPSTQR